MRFRPRFSLRMLFALIAVFAGALGWLAWEREVARERQSLIGLLDRPDGQIWRDGDAPYLRRLFGDYLVQKIFLPANLDAEKDRFAAAFPEAEIRIEIAPGNFPVYRPSLSPPPEIHWPAPSERE